MHRDFTADLLLVLKGEVTEAQLAEKHGLSGDEVVRLRHAYVSGLQTASSRREPRGARRASVGLLAALGVGLVAGEARSGSCTAPSPFFAALGLEWFCPDEPALAAEVNGNFEKLGRIVQQKLGTLAPVASGTSNISTGAVTATSATINGAANVTSGLTVSGGATLNGAISAPGSVTVGAPGSTLLIRGTVQLFGAETVVNAGTTYTAPTDGFVVVRLTAQGTCNGGPAQAFGYADANLTPSTVRSQTSVHGGCANQDYATSQGGFTMPVRKDERYLVGQVGGSLSASFIPLGR